MLPLSLIGAVLLIVFLLGQRLTTSWFPTPQDDAMQLESAVTKTADFAGTTYDNGIGYSPGAIGQQVVAVVAISAMDKTTGDETYKFVLQESVDGVTWTDAGPIITVTAIGPVSIPAWLSQRYCRLNLDVAGTTPSITYDAWLNPNIN